MGIGKSKITPSINVDDMLKKAEISHEIEAESRMQTSGSQKSVKQKRHC